MEIGFTNSYFRLFLFIFFLYSCATPVQKKEKQGFYTASGVSYLNKLRNDLGMISFKSNQKLSQSSLNHARYLTERGYQEGHFENYKKSRLFTGYDLSDRVKFVGYNSLYTGENITQTSNFDPSYLEKPISESDQAITVLLAAIYHRFFFLDYTFDEIGFGKDSKNYVYNLGNSDLNNICSKKHKRGSGKFYTGLCWDKGSMIKAELKEGAINKVISKNNKDYILYPGPSFENFHPVFYEEKPDPLPDLSISGNPISIHFSPKLKKNVKIVKFKLVNLKNKMALRVRQISSKNDPNKSFKKNFFAFFPLKRLDWDTFYRASLTYQICKKKCLSKERKVINWSFKTRKLKYKTLTVSTQNPRPIQIRNGEKVILYFKQDKLNEKSRSFSFSFKHFKNKKPFVDFKLLDSNTGFFEVTNAPLDQIINLYFKIGRKKKKLIVKIKK